MEANTIITRILLFVEAIALYPSMCTFLDADQEELEQARRRQYPLLSTIV